MIKIYLGLLLGEIKNSEDRISKNLVNQKVDMYILKYPRIIRLFHVRFQNVL